MDLSTIIGFVFAMIGIVGGLILEDGAISDIIKPTAALIVLGGTFGAVMISFPLDMFIAACKLLITILIPPKNNPAVIIDKIVEMATKARKEGVISLEADAKNITDPFFKKAIMMAIDGADPKELKHALETQLGYMDEEGAKIPKVWEGAGGYAPTIGIIGAVMGLIQVMKNLEDIEAVGHGIATAFVATIYGVGFSNILFLPAANKITLAHKKSIVIKEMIIEGVLLILEGVNPRVITDKLSVFFSEKVTSGKAEEKK